MQPSLKENEGYTWQDMKLLSSLICLIVSYKITVQSIGKEKSMQIFPDYGNAQDVN